jgi:hypothetical protein
MSFPPFLSWDIHDILAQRLFQHGRHGPRYIIRVHFGDSSRGCSEDPEVSGLYLHMQRFGACLFVPWLMALCDTLW